MAKAKPSLRFININRLDATNVKGFQVRINDYTPFVRDLTEESLKKAIGIRNQYYIDNHYYVPQICRQPNELSKKDNTRTTGWHGLSYTTPNEVGAPLVISCSVRNLRTGKPHTYSTRVHLFKNETAAMKHARSVRDKNVKQYNAIVEIYNEMAFKELIKAAKAEHKTLQPHLHELKGFDQKRWDKAVKKIFPMGFVSSIECKA